MHTLGEGPTDLIQQQDIRRVQQEACDGHTPALTTTEIGHLRSRQPTGGLRLRSVGAMAMGLASFVYL